MPHELSRWEADAFSQAPYQFRDCNCVINRKRHVRRLYHLEEERLMGFPDDWTFPLVRDNADGGTSRESQHRRHTMLGNAWSIRVCIWILLAAIGSSAACRPQPTHVFDPTEPHDGFIARLSFPHPLPDLLPLSVGLPTLTSVPGVASIL